MKESEKWEIKGNKFYKAFGMYPPGYGTVLMQLKGMEKNNGI